MSSVQPEQRKNVNIHLAISGWAELWVAGKCLLLPISEIDLGVQQPHRGPRSREAKRLQACRASDCADGGATIFSSCLSDLQKTISHILTYVISHAKPMGSNANLVSEGRKWIEGKAVLCSAISRV